MEPTASVSKLPSATQEPLPTPVPTPEVIASPPAAAEAWQVVAIAPEGQVHDLISTQSGGLLAVGNVGWNGAVWLSEDGTSWTPVTEVPAVDINTARALTGVTYGAGLYIAWGSQGGRYSEGYQGVVWTSADGIHWTQVAVLQGNLLKVVPGGPGFIGIGSKGGGLNYLNGALAWSSADGLNWTVSPIVPGPDGAAMLDVVPFGQGFVAVGVAGSDPEPYGAVSWRTQDGVKWTQLAQDPGLAGASLYDVVGSNGRLVATGSISAYPPASLVRPAVWVSDDGSSWAEAYSRDCCGEITEIVQSGAELWGLFRWYVPDIGGGTALLRSAEGSQWSLIGTPQIGADIVWYGLVNTEQGLRGLAYRDIGDGLSQPVLLLPPAGL